LSDDNKGGPPVEKVMDMAPNYSQDISNNSFEDFPAFPTPIGLGAGRTAFYA